MAKQKRRRREMTKRPRAKLLKLLAFIAPLASVALGTAGAATRDADFYIESAKRYRQENDFRSAEIQLRNAVRSAPQDGEVRLQLAEVYLLLNQISNAEAELIVARQRGITEERLAPLRAE